MENQDQIEIDELILLAGQWSIDEQTALQLSLAVSNELRKVVPNPFCEELVKQ